MRARIRPALLAVLLPLGLASAIAQNVPPSTATVTTSGAAHPQLGWQTRHTPAYPIPYGPARVEEITPVLDRVLTYLERATPARLIDLETNTPVADAAGPLPARPGFERGDFLPISYEWGVTYSGMLHAAEALGNERYRRYVGERLELIRRLADHYTAHPPGADAPRRFALRSVLKPESLDDSGAMAAAMLKAEQAGVAVPLRPLIDRYLGYISTGQLRFDDGTLARNRPLPGSLWLDDLYMSVPALAQIGKLTGERRYFDDAARQVLQFAGRMFVREKGLYLHGWVQGMEPHPAFHWARANGWAAMAKVELLSVLPEDHPARPELLALLRSHLQGLAASQGVDGRWHQLLDRPATYPETSASAMFVYAFARAINRGWIDPLAFGPAASIGWHAVAKQVNSQGQVENTCVGTGMGWEPVFYAYRPVSVYAAHGYGPVLLAGAEMATLHRGAGARAVVHDGGLHFGEATSTR